MNSVIGPAAPNAASRLATKKRVSHEKAQKTQKMIFVLFCGLIDVELRFEDIDGIGANHYLKFARLDYITHVTIPEPEMLRPQHKLNAPLLTRL